MLIAFGFGIGLLIGMTGMGGGSLMTPLLILTFGTAPVTAVGSDIAYAAITKTVGGWRRRDPAVGRGHRARGRGKRGLRSRGDDPHRLSIPGVLIGSHLTARLPTGLLRVALGIVLICSSLALFDKAGVDVPLVVVIALPAALGIALGARELVCRARAVHAASSGASGAP